MSTVAVPRKVALADASGRVVDVAARTAQHAPLIDISIKKARSEGDFTSMESRAAWHSALISLGAPESAELCRLTRLRAEAVSCIFTRALAERGARVEVGLDGQQWAVKAAGPHEWANLNAWLNGFGAAAALRLTDIVATLRSVSVDGVLRKVGGFEELGYLTVAALQALLSSSPDAGAALDAAEKACEPGATWISAAHAKAISAPQLRVLRVLIDRRTSDDFNSAIVDALEQQERYWLRQKAQPPADGFLPIALVGLCALGVDRGLEFRVESPYLPRRLVLNQCGQ